MGELMRRLTSPHESPAQAVLWACLQMANTPNPDTPVVVSAGDLYEALRLLDEAQVELDRIDAAARATMPPGSYWAIMRWVDDPAEEVVVLSVDEEQAYIWQPNRKRARTVNPALLERL